MVVEPSFVFTRKAVVDDVFIRNSGKICKSIVDSDASQLDPYSVSAHANRTIHAIGI